MLKEYIKNRANSIRRCLNLRKDNIQDHTLWKYDNTIELEGRYKELKNILLVMEELEERRILK